LPVTTAATPATAMIRENAISGLSYIGFSIASSGTMQFQSVTNAAPTLANGDIFFASFIYQAN
jgi:hypothetical protein